MVRIPLKAVRAASALSKPAAALAFATFLSATFLSAVPLFAGAPFAAQGAETAAPAPDGQSRSRPIVNGMRVQPRPDDLERSNRTDVNRNDAKDVDDLYRRLMNPDQFRDAPARPNR